jgi:glutamyl-tRNA synthetase
MSTPVRVRMAPSPTGYFHIGSTRTALFNYLYAKHTGGTFILRVEDTDQERSKRDHEQLIYDAFNFLGIQADEGPEQGGPYVPYRQSERNDIYKEWVAKIINSGKTYWCYCTPEELTKEREEQTAAKMPPGYSGRCKHRTAEDIEDRKQKGITPCLRIAMPDEPLTFHDLIRGDVTFDLTLMSDFVIAKADGTPTYNFACVADDAQMKITHVIRGEDHIANTPKQIVLYQVLGLTPPQFAHIPLILNDDRSKMSKRKNDCNFFSYVEKGYLPEALINFLSLIGWSPGTDREFFTKQELIEAFSLEHVAKSGAIFNDDKLNWFNGHYIRELSAEQLYEKVKPFTPENWYVQKEKMHEILPLVQERLVVLSDVKEFISFVFEPISVSVGSLVGKHTSQEETAAMLAKLHMLLSNTSWDEVTLETTLRDFCEQEGWKTGEIFMPLRIAVTGSKATPPLFSTLVVLGKELALERIQNAINVL